MKSLNVCVSVCEWLWLEVSPFFLNVTASNSPMVVRVIALYFKKIVLFFVGKVKWLRRMDVSLIFLLLFAKVLWNSGKSSTCSVFLSSTC